VKFRIRPFALASGILWGTTLCGGALWTWLKGGREKKELFLGKFYKGYDASPKGSLVGFIWGLTDGAIGGSLFASVCNVFSPVSRDEKGDTPEEDTADSANSEQSDRVAA
jgi:hypothetical protein